jgi:thioesterase domain-containing protein
MITNLSKEIYVVQPEAMAADTLRSAEFRGAKRTEAGTERLTVFLMPGVFYGQPKKTGSITASELLNLARFRYALRDHIEFVPIGYPEWREMNATKPDFDTIVTFVLKEVLGRSSDDDDAIYLAGYSFGGWVAFATAHRLVQAGRQVAFLGLLDTRFPMKRRASAWIRSLGCQIMEGNSTPLLRLVLKTAITLRSYQLLQVCVWFLLSIGSRRVDAELHDILRTRALALWRPNALNVPTFLFRTDDDDPPQAFDCGWGALCSTLSVVRVGGDHRSMLTPPNINRVCASFLEALRTVK